MCRVGRDSLLNPIQSAIAALGGIQYWDHLHHNPLAIAVRVCSMMYMDVPAVIGDVTRVMA